MKGIGLTVGALAAVALCWFLVDAARTASLAEDLHVPTTTITLPPQSTQLGSAARLEKLCACIVRPNVWDATDHVLTWLVHTHEVVKTLPSICGPVHCMPLHAETP